MAETMKGNAGLLGARKLAAENLASVSRLQLRPLSETQSAFQVVRDEFFPDRVIVTDAALSEGGE